MVELSSALSVLFTTLEGYYQHPKAIISAFGKVQYHGKISSPLGRTLSVLQKMFITLEEKRDDKPPIQYGIVHGFSVALIIFLCGNDDIPFAVLVVSSTFVHYKEFPRRHSLTLMRGVSCGYLGLTLTELNLQEKYKCHLRSRI